MRMEQCSILNTLSFTCFTCKNCYILGYFLSFAINLLLFLAWTSWSECSQKCHIGSRRRSRTITQAATWGGDCPFHLSELEVCGAVNGGCQHNCNPHTGHCSCLAGYTASGTLNTIH